MKLRFLLILVTFGVLAACKKPKLEEPAPPPPPPLPVVKTPKLITDSIAGLTVYSVILGGKITDTGGSAITEVGIVVGLNSAPTVTTNLNKFKSQPDSTGSFSNTVIGVPTSTTFYVRVYAINAQGVGYGNEVKFTSPTGNIEPVGPPTVLTTQQEVNEYGAHGYTTLINGIEINGRDITDLSPLKSLVIIGGSLRIKNTSLENLRGLDSLEVVSNTFYNGCYIDLNRLLKDLTGLGRLKRINGPVQISFNSAMVNLNGLSSLGILYFSSLSILDCPSLQSLNGLEKLNFMDGSIGLHRNPVLTDIKGFRNLQTITEDISISRCHALTNVDGFEKLTNLRTLHLNDNDNITNLNGFKNLVTMEAALLDLNPKLSDLSAMKNIKDLKYLHVMRCHSLVDLTGLSSLETIKYMEVSSNDNLINLKGLDKFHSAHSVGIASNNALQNLKGLDSLKTITGPLGIGYNPSLNSLTGLENLRTVQEQITINANSPQLNYCPLKPFLLQYTGNSFSLVVNFVPISIAHVISTCP